MRRIFWGLLTLITPLVLSVNTYSGELIINHNAADPAPKKAITEVIDAFKEANPDINVEVNVFAHEAYKTSIRNFLSAEAPDIAAWFAGNRMAPFVNAGLFEDITDLWETEGLNDSMASAVSSLTIDGKKWGIPYSYYQWGVYYRQDIFEEHGLEVPTTWSEFFKCMCYTKGCWHNSDYYWNEVSLDRWWLV